MSDLQELFARLKASSSTNNHDAPLHSQQNTNRPSIWAQAQPQHPYQAPTVSSPLFSPPIHTPNPVHDSRIISPVGGMPGTSTSGGLAPDSQSTNNLLNLLTFNNNNRASHGGEGASPLATMQSVGSGGGSSTSRNALAASDHPGTPRPASQQQDLLLNLLKKPNAAKAIPAVVQSIEQESAPTPPAQADIDTLAQSFADASFHPAPSPSRSARSSLPHSSPARQFGTSASRETTPFEAPQPQRASVGMFNYVNPFDQLHSSSPLNRTPKPEAQQEKKKKKVEILKHERDVSSGINGGGGDGAAPAAKSRKKDGQSEVHNDRKNNTVSEALEDVGEKVDRQVEQALASASSNPEATGSTDAVTDGNTAETEPAIKTEMQDAGKDDVESSWESAEDSANERAQMAAQAAAQEEFKVKVYNFPMKPFVTITITPSTSQAMNIRQDEFMVIAQLKKDFDQMDRCLGTASKDHIVYAQTGAKRDNNGFRIIRQDTGKHKQVFRQSGERVFSVQFCTPPPKDGDVESILGTGVNGSVFWTSLARSRPDLFEEDDVEGHGFIMPAPASAEEQTASTATTTVKTRAKLSCRHTDVFALSRSKIIHVISPETAKDRTYCNASTRKVNTQKYLDEHGLRINTGKAGKDFCWSEDDTVIASLDKSGVVKFWDVKPLLAKATDVSGATHPPIELSTPVWSITATASIVKPDEKAASVSSIMLLDKERPHTKGIALRYMLVGFKQNHILQLWDLGLAKVVQELRLPHEKDSDGFCSVTYHAKTGIIAVGHPTRNSVYFIHLSAPKYNLPALDQARYLSYLATNDRGLPKPESTAIMSGLREFSFNRVGAIRSLDMLKALDPENVGEKGTVEETMFELYIMHSKGVVGIPIKRIDLGWNAQNNMEAPLDAVNAGVISVVDLRLPVPGAKTEPMASEASSQTETPSKKAKKQEEKVKTTPAAAVPRTTASPAPARNGAVRPEPPSKQIPEAPTPSEPSVNPPLMTADSYAMAAQRVKSPTSASATRQHAEATRETMKPSKGDAALAPTPAQVVSAAPAGEAGEISNEIQANLSQRFDGLYQRLDADKRVSEAAGAARQDAMLRLVSSTLTENVEQSLHRIIGASIQNEVIPMLTGLTSNVVERKMTEIVPGAVNGSIARELKVALPVALQGALKEALRDQQVHKMISDLTANNVSQIVQKNVSSMMQQSLPNMATQASHKMLADLEMRMGQRLREAESQRQEANQQVEQLSRLVTSLSETVNRMAEGQTAFQEQILKMQKESSKSAGGVAESSSGAGSAASGAGGAARSESDSQKSAEEEEVSRITQMLVNGEFEEATIQWLQSSNQAHLFDNLFVRVNPQYLRQVTPLVALSVSAAITASLGTNTDQRLDWLGAVLNQINVRDPDIADVAPKIMDVLGQRLQGAYMAFSEENPNDPVLRKISALNRSVAEVKRMTG